MVFHGCSHGILKYSRITLKTQFSKGETNNVLKQTSTLFKLKKNLTGHGDLSKNCILSTIVTL